MKAKRYKTSENIRFL